MLEKETIRTLYRNRLKGKLTPLSGETGTDWLKIRDAITKAVEESIRYKWWKNRKWLQTWHDEIQQAIEEKKARYRNYLQNKRVYIEYKKQAIERKTTKRQRREDWDKFVKALKRDITGTQRQSFKISEQLQLQERYNDHKTNSQPTYSFLFSYPFPTLCSLNPHSITINLHYFLSLSNSFLLVVG